VRFSGVGCLCSSAVAISISGMVRPSALAVLRLRTSNLASYDLISVVWTPEFCRRLRVAAGGIAEGTGQWIGATPTPTAPAPSLLQARFVGPWLSPSACFISAGAFR
jgi:hypothetical protein